MCVADFWDRLDNNVIDHSDVSGVTENKAICRRLCLIKHTTTLFSLSDHYILSREWRVIVDQLSW